MKDCRLLYIGQSYEKRYDVNVVTFIVSKGILLFKAQFKYKQKLDAQMDSLNVVVDERYSSKLPLNLISGFGGYDMNSEIATRVDSVGDGIRAMLLPQEVADNILAAFNEADFKPLNTEQAEKLSTGYLTKLAGRVDLEEGLHLEMDGQNRTYKVYLDIFRSVGCDRIVIDRQEHTPYSE